MKNRSILSYLKEKKTLGKSISAPELAILELDERISVLEKELKKDHQKERVLVVDPLGR